MQLNPKKKKKVVICMLPVVDILLAVVLFTECLWSNLDTLSFKNLVHIYQKLSQNTMSRLFRYNGLLQIHLFEHETPIGLNEALQILHILYQVRKCLDTD